MLSLHSDLLIALKAAILFGCIPNMAKGYRPHRNALGETLLENYGFLMTLWACLELTLLPVPKMDLRDALEAADHLIFLNAKYFSILLLLENLAKLFSLMDPNSPERVAFVSRALKWSSGGSGKLGHPKLHQLLAITLWKGKKNQLAFLCFPLKMLKVRCYKRSALGII